MMSTVLSGRRRHRASRMSLAARIAASPLACSRDIVAAFGQRAHGPLPRHVGAVQVHRTLHRCGTLGSVVAEVGEELVDAVAGEGRLDRGIATRRLLGVPAMHCRLVRHSPDHEAGGVVGGPGPVPLRGIGRRQHAERAAKRSRTKAGNSASRGRLAAWYPSQVSLWSPTIVDQKSSTSPRCQVRSATDQPGQAPTAAVVPAASQAATNASPSRARAASRSGFSMQRCCHRIDTRRARGRAGTRPPPVRQRRARWV